MGLFHRRDAPPADALAHLPPGERVVSWADVAGGGVVLASPSGLWWPSPDGVRPIGWQHVNKATWDDGVLTVVEAEVRDDAVLVDRPAVSAVLVVPRDLPPTVRKRVEANVVSSQVLPVVGGAARFVARRIPGQDGVNWWARLEDGTPDTETIRSAVLARLALLQAQWEAERAAQRW